MNTGRWNRVNSLRNSTFPRRKLPSPKLRQLLWNPSKTRQETLSFPCTRGHVEWSFWEITDSKSSTFFKYKSKSTPMRICMSWGQSKIGNINLSQIWSESKRKSKKRKTSCTWSEKRTYFYLTEMGSTLENRWRKKYPRNLKFLHKTKKERRQKKFQNKQS